MSSTRDEAERAVLVALMCNAGAAPIDQAAAIVTALRNRGLLVQVPPHTPHYTRPALRRLG